MADIPYHKWLGLDSKIKNPHHFQLLGVSSKVEDPDSYRIQVLAAAQAKLEMLDQIEDAASRQLIEKLKQRINTARDVLSNPQKRTNYVKQLKAQIAASKSAKGQGSQPPTTATSKTETLRPPATPTIKSPAKSKPPSPKTGEVSSVPPPTVASQSASSTSQIPMAVPLDQSAQGLAPNQAVPPGVPGAIPISPPVATSELEEIDLSQLKLKKVSRKKRSKAFSLVLALMLLGAIAVAFGIYANFDKLREVTKTAPVENSAAPAITKQEAVAAGSGSENPAEKSSSSTTAKQPELAEIDLDALPQLNVDEVMEHPDTLSATHRNVRRERAKAEETKRRLAEAGENDLVATANTDKKPPKTKSSTRPERISNKPTKLFESDQLAEFRQRLQRARRSLLRRDKTTAEVEMQQAEEMFSSVLGSEFAIAPQQQGLQDLLEATKQLAELLDGFWDQNVKSCRGIAAGQEIKVGQQIVGFVEADDSQVILRNAGANVVYRYDYLPPGLAVVLANQGAIEDIPTWRMQQAAFYSLYADQDPKYEDQVERLVELAETDGHDGSGLRRFLNPEIENIGVPAARVDMPDRQQLAEIIKDFRALHEYDEPSKLKPDRADELAQLLLDAQPENTEQRLAYLVEARQLGIRAGNAYVVEDAILELNVWANLRQTDLLTNAFLALSKQKLDTAQARRLMETVIPFLKSAEVKSANQQNVKRLIKRLTKIAEENEFVDSKRRLNQVK